MYNFSLCQKRSEVTSQLMHSQEYQSSKDQWHQTLEKKIGRVVDLVTLKILIQSPWIVACLYSYSSIKCWSIIKCMFIHVRGPKVVLKAHVNEEVIQIFMVPSPAALLFLSYCVPVDWYRILYGQLTEWRQDLDLIYRHFCIIWRYYLKLDSCTTMFPF